MRNSTGVTLCIIVWTLLVLVASTSWGHGVDCDQGTYHNVNHSHFVDCLHENGNFDDGCVSKVHLHPDAIQHSGPDCDEEVKDWFKKKHWDSDVVARQTLSEHAGGPSTPSRPSTPSKPPPTGAGHPPPPPPPTKQTLYVCPPTLHTETLHTH